MVDTTCLCTVSAWILRIRMPHNRVGDGHRNTVSNPWHQSCCEKAAYAEVHGLYLENTRLQPLQSPDQPTKKYLMAMDPSVK